MITTARVTIRNSILQQHIEWQVNKSSSRFHEKRKSYLRAEGEKRWHHISPPALAHLHVTIFFYVVGISVCKKTALLSSLNSNSLVLSVYFVSLDAWLRGILIFSSWLGCTKWDVQIEIHQRPLFVSQTFRAAGCNWLLSDRFWVQFRRDSNMIRSYYIPARIDHYNISAKY